MKDSFKTDRRKAIVKCLAKVFSHHPDIMHAVTDALHVGAEDVYEDELATIVVDQIGNLRSIDQDSDEGLADLVGDLNRSANEPLDDEALGPFVLMTDGDTRWVEFMGATIWSSEQRQHEDAWDGPSIRDHLIRSAKSITRRINKLADKLNQEGLR